MWQEGLKRETEAFIILTLLSYLPLVAADAWQEQYCNALGPFQSQSLTSSVTKTWPYWRKDIIIKDSSPIHIIR